MFLTSRVPLLNSFQTQIQRAEQCINSALIASTTFATAGAFTAAVGYIGRKTGAISEDVSNWMIQAGTTAFGLGSSISIGLVHRKAQIRTNYFNADQFEHLESPSSSDNASGLTSFAKAGLRTCMVFTALGAAATLTGALLKRYNPENSSTADTLIKAGTASICWGVAGALHIIAQSGSHLASNAKHAATASGASLASAVCASLAFIPHTNAWAFLAMANALAGISNGVGFGTVAVNPPAD